MKIITRIVQVINLLLFLLVGIGLFMYASSILATLTTLVGVVVVLILPIMIGFILTVIKISKTRNQGKEMNCWDQFLAFFPIVNMILLLIVVIGGLI